VALGAGRVSIREALQKLVYFGLLETRQGGGTYVREYSGEILLYPLLPMLALDTLDILHILEYRKRILDAIKARDGPRAESLMEGHVKRTIRRLKHQRGGDRKSCAGRKTDGRA
jgi:GntR family transcriptional repressor for pyruvate dehydrogenase complex